MKFTITPEAEEFANSKGKEQTFANKLNPQNAGTVSDTGEKSASPYTIMGKLGEYALNEVFKHYKVDYDYVGSEIVYKGSAKGPDFIVYLNDREVTIDVKTRMHATKNSWCRQEHSMEYDATVFAHHDGEDIVFNGWLGVKDFDKFETIYKYQKTGYDIPNTELRPMKELIERITNER